MMFDPDRMHSPQVLTWIFMMMAYGFLEIGISRRNRGNTARKKVSDVTYFAVTVPSMVAMYAAVVEACFRGHSLPAAMFTMGTAVLAGGIVLRVIAKLQLGKSFSTKVERSEGQKLCTTGIYRLIRHPLYSATLLQVLGTGIMLNSLVAIALFPLCVAGIVLRISKEERFMATEFPEYVGYAKRTRRLVPWIY
jgi:protein-S-isoprenylcysteine O-methyltransferase Ste14